MVLINDVNLRSIYTLACFLKLLQEYPPDEHEVRRIFLCTFVVCKNMSLKYGEQHIFTPNRKQRCNTLYFATQSVWQIFPLHSLKKRDNKCTHSRIYYLFLYHHFGIVPRTDSIVNFVLQGNKFYYTFYS